MGIFLTSDLHLGHKFVAKLRGFDDVTEHDALIIRNIRKQVKENDTLYILGDVAMGGWAETIKPVKELSFTKVLVTGNHDRCFVGSQNGIGHIGDVAVRGGFHAVTQFARLRVDQEYMLSHFPYEDIDTAGPEGRFDEYRLKDMGIPIFHGHTHSDKKLTFSTQGTPQIHVGLDAWGMRPVSLHDAIMAGR